MAKPTRPTAPPKALRSNPETFSANAEASIQYQWDAFPDWLDDMADFTEEQADAALAAALGGDLPVLTGKAGQFLRVNEAGTAPEFKKALTLTDESDDAELALSTIGRAILAALNAAAQRAVLGITSATEAQLNTLGAGAQVITDWDAIAGSGFYCGVSASNGPATATFYAVASGQSSSALTVLAMRSGSDEIWRRAKVAGTWGSWVKIFPSGVGEGQTTSTPTRVTGTSYQNTTGRSIQVAVTLPSTTQNFQVSTDNSTWVTVANGAGEGGGETNTVTWTIPPGHYYRVTGGFDRWVELS